MTPDHSSWYARARAVVGALFALVILVVAFAGCEAKRGSIKEVEIRPPVPTSSFRPVR